MSRLMILSLFLSFTFAVYADVEQREAYLKDRAKAFIQAKNARQQSNTTEDDIDHFISLLADDFVDEHIKYKVVVTDKDELRKGMVAKMQDEIFYSRISIDEMMVGSNVVFLKYTESAKVKPTHLDRVVEYTSTHLLSLEFNEEGLINHIRRHHAL
ncbi:nuclear transport factor 2 family protein [Alteromonadaceae bacterium M269]|nr:nuclear transport factor 2 family protein [Alteromonadaceae bacterium M269]